MRESLKLLIELQELDLIIDGERKKQQEIPEKIKKLQEEYNKDFGAPNLRSRPAKIYKAAMSEIPGFTSLNWKKAAR